MSYIKKLKEQVNITILFVLLGFIGNAFAYLYKIFYFFYFKIPISLLSHSILEVVIYSTCSIIVSLLYYYSGWFISAPNNKIAKYLYKELGLRKKQNRQSIVLILIGGVIVYLIQWYQTRNIEIYAPFSFTTTFLIIVFIQNIRTNKGLRHKKEKEKKPEISDRELIKYFYNREPLTKGENDDIDEEKYIEKMYVEIAEAKDEISNYRDRKDIGTLFVVIAFTVSVLYNTAYLGWDCARQKAEFPIVTFENREYVCLAEYKDNYICTKYKGFNEIDPEYQVISFTDAEKVSIIRTGPLSLIKTP